MERPDWEQAIKTPVGILPCGSGNALSGSINHYAGYEMYLSSPGTHVMKISSSSESLPYFFKELFDQNFKISQCD